VTTPIFRSDWAAVEGAAADPDGSAEPALAGGCDAGVVDAEGLGELPVEQAPTRMASPLTSVRPNERVRMCPPPDRDPSAAA
jgi:hypothetical protein